MNEEEVLAAMVEALFADKNLTDIVGRNIGPWEEGSEKFEVNTMRYAVISDSETELFNPIIVQIDFKAQGRPSAIIISKRLRKILHSDARRVFGGIEMQTTLEDSRDIDNPDQGIVRRQLDFRFEPVRKLIVDTE